MNYLNDGINYVIQDLPGIIKQWIIDKFVAFFTWMVHLPLWIKSLVLGLIILISVFIVLLVIKYRNEWRGVY